MNIKSRSAILLFLAGIILIFCWFLLAIQSFQPIATLFTPFITKSQLTANELAVVVNESDPLSVKIAAYYQQQRHIPQQNMISVSFVADRSKLSSEEFNRIQTRVLNQVPSGIQAFALTWIVPYRVDCMSMTSAFAFGFDQRYCAQGCQLTQSSLYFNHNSAKPFDDFRIRPTMSIAATSFEQAKALIDRGVSSDSTHPTGTAYLMDTGDKARNVRAAFYSQITQNLSSRFKIQVIKGNVLVNKQDVMFYFTGLSKVDKISTNQFLPGAVADHLTSFGGALIDSSQMSSLRWLEAGATGSYGAVVEPCNFPQKFPHPFVLMSHYLAGNTLIEAYWKSVAYPGQGIFIGEPLARPFIR